MSYFLIEVINLIILSLVFVPFEFRKCIEWATFKTTRPYFVQYFWVWSYHSTVVWDINIMTILSTHTTAMQEITNTKMTTGKITTKPVSEKYIIYICAHRAVCCKRNPGLTTLHVITPRAAVRGHVLQCCGTAAPPRSVGIRLITAP